MSKFVKKKPGDSLTVLPRGRNPSIKWRLLPRVQINFELRHDRPKVLWLETLHQKHTKELFQAHAMANDSWVSAQRRFDSRGT